MFQAGFLYFKKVICPVRLLRQIGGLANAFGGDALAILEYPAMCARILRWEGDGKISEVSPIEIRFRRPDRSLHHYKNLELET